MIAPATRGLLRVIDAKADGANALVGASAPTGDMAGGVAAAQDALRLLGPDGDPLIEHLRDRRKVLALSRVTQAVRDLLALYGLLDAITPERVYESTRAAMAAYKTEVEAVDQSDEQAR